MKNINTKIFLLTFLTFQLSALTILASTNTPEEEKSKIEVNYKQRHNTLLINDEKEGKTELLFADAIKIKRDLTLKKETNTNIEDEIYLSFDVNEIPSDDLYKGIWNTERLHSYADLNVKAEPVKIDISDFQMPISKGHVTSNYGFRGKRMHYGIDLKVQVGDTIYAAFDGKIRVKNFDKAGYGYYLVMRHPNGLETVYGHLSKFLVETDDVIKKGEPIALGGNTGRSTGSHLHFEMRYLGIALNPAELVDFQNYLVINDEYTITPQKMKQEKSIKFHTIKKGETLSSISKKYKTSVNNLCKLNKLTAKSTLKIGNRLRVG